MNLGFCSKLVEGKWTHLNIKVLFNFASFPMFFPNSSKIKKNLDYLGVFIYILLVLGKNPSSLAAKL